MSLFVFFVLAYGIAWLFWVPAAILFRASAGDIPAGLVVLQTIGAAAPSIAALLVLGFSNRRDVIRATVRRYARWRVSVGWYLAATLLMPAVTLAALLIQSLADADFVIPRESPLGDLLASAGVWVIVLTFPLQLAGLMFSSPLLEEFGWRGYALPALQAYLPALPAALLVGVAWGLWHWPLMISYGDPLLPYLVTITVQSVVAAWLLNSTGSMLIAMAYHASLVVATTTLSTGSGEWLIAALAWVTAAVVILFSGWRDLSHRGRLALSPHESTHL